MSFRTRCLELRFCAASLDTGAVLKSQPDDKKRKYNRVELILNAVEEPIATTSTSRSGVVRRPGVWSKRRANAHGRSIATPRPISPKPCMCMHIHIYGEHRPASHSPGVSDEVNQVRRTRYGVGGEARRHPHTPHTISNNACQRRGGQSPAAWSVAGSDKRTRRRSAVSGGWSRQESASRTHSMAVSKSSNVLFSAPGTSSDFFSENCLRPLATNAPRR